MISANKLSMNILHKIIKAQKARRFLQNTAHLLAKSVFLSLNLFPPYSCEVFSVGLYLISPRIAGGITSLLSELSMIFTSTLTAGCPLEV